MMIAELLGPEGFGIVRKDDIESMKTTLSRREIGNDVKVRDFFVASCAELAIWTQSTVGNVTVPLVIGPPLITTVEYKCNTCSHTICQPHITVDQNHDEYAFLFVSDAWKMRRLLPNENVLNILATDPKRIADAIVPSGWTFAVEDSAGIAKDLTVMLWSAKALTLSDVSEVEARGRLIAYAQKTNLGTRVPGMKIRQPGTA